MKYSCQQPTAKLKEALPTAAKAKLNQNWLMHHVDYIILISLEQVPAWSNIFNIWGSLASNRQSTLLPNVTLTNHCWSNTQEHTHTQTRRGIAGTRPQHRRGGDFQQRMH